MRFQAIKKIVLQSHHFLKQLHSQRNQNFQLPQSCELRNEQALMQQEDQLMQSNHFDTLPLKRRFELPTIYRCALLCAMGMCKQKT
jgi:hypothetical protein